MIDEGPAPPALSMAEAKQYLRVEQDEEDALIARLIGAATEACEGFTAQALVVRDVAETVRADGEWQRLGRAPVRSIAAPAGCETDIDAGGNGWVRIPRGSEATVTVSYQAGIAEEAGALPEALRQGVARLAGYLFTNRDGDGQPPAAVAALWRPWRRMRLR